MNSSEQTLSQYEKIGENFLCAYPQACVLDSRSVLCRTCSLTIFLHDNFHPLKWIDHLEQCKQPKNTAHQNTFNRTSNQDDPLDYQVQVQKKLEQIALRFTEPVQTFYTHPPEPPNLTHPPVPSNLTHPPEPPNLTHPLEPSGYAHPYTPPGYTYPYPPSGYIHPHLPPGYTHPHPPPGFFYPPSISGFTYPPELPGSVYLPPPPGSTYSPSSSVMYPPPPKHPVFVYPSFPPGFTYSTPYPSFAYPPPPSAFVYPPSYADSADESQLLSADYTPPIVVNASNFVPGPEAWPVRWQPNDVPAVTSNNQQSPLIVSNDILTTLPSIESWYPTSMELSGTPLITVPIHLPECLQHLTLSQPGSVPPCLSQQSRRLSEPCPRFIVPDLRKDEAGKLKKRRSFESFPRRV